MMLLLICALLCSANRVSPVQNRDGKPNIIYILADDLGIGDVRCYNPAGKIPTPNADRLAREGMRFTDAHSACAVCTPSRYAILTGRYCWRTSLKRGVLTGFSPPLLEPARLTVAELLRRSGYSTACIGKWHLGMTWPKTGQDIDYGKPITAGPNAAGFDYFYGISASLDMPPYIFIENDRTVGRGTDSKDPPLPQSLGSRRGPAEPGFQFPDVLKTLTHKAVGYIRDRPGDRPFFLYIAFASPHTPIVPRHESRGKGAIGEYGDFVWETDRALGDVLSALKEKGFDKNTLVIFTSDNGFAPYAMTPEELARVGHKPSCAFRGTKSDIWEGGHRIPFIVRWPGRVRPGSLCDETVCQSSLIATCAELLSVRLSSDEGEDSFSIAPILLGRKPSRSTHDAIVSQSGQGMLAIRKRKWKYIDGQGSGGWSKGSDALPGQLYDMDNDPGETHNLYAENPQVVKDLAALLERYRRDGRSRP